MKTYLTFACLILVICLSGCAVNEGTYPAPQSEIPGELKNTTEILDGEMAGHITVDLMPAGRNAAGKMTAMAHLRNRSNQDLKIQAQTVFRDYRGMTINDNTSWRALVLTPNETRTITATAASQRAELYTIRVQRLRQ